MPTLMRRLFQRRPIIEPPTARPRAVKVVRGAKTMQQARIVNQKPAMRQSRKDHRKGSLRSCLCGCGKTPRTGRYLPGHQTRRLWALVDKALAGDTKARAELEREGWSRFLLFKEQAQH